jgi:NTE family protein
MEFHKRKIGLALGGGAVLGAAHIGVIKALEEYEIKIDFISGTSIGSVVAALYAFGKTWEEIKEIALNLEWLDISEISPSRYGLLTNKKIEDVIINNIGDVLFEDSPIPLAAVATDITFGRKVFMNKGRVADAVMASTCLPGIFAPVQRGEQFLIDGGVVENVPVLSLKKLGAAFTIGVDLISKQAFEKPDNIFEVLINTVNITLVNVTKLQTENADLLISPELSDFNVYDTDQVAKLVERGYEEGKRHLEQEMRKYSKLNK